MSAQASRLYAGYVVLLLFLVNAANYGQRMIISVLLPAIKEDVALSDSELGILMGGGFALFFAIAGVPLARLADRSVRRTFLAGAVVFWSGATALFSVTQSFVQMLTARVALGIGESVCIPTSHSLITDYVRNETRPFAFGVHSTGGVVGVTLSLILGGYLAANFGWRGAMLMAAIPGFVLAVIIFFTLREPRRLGRSGRRKQRAVSAASRDPLSAGAQVLCVPADRHLLQPVDRVRPQPVAAVVLRAPVRIEPLRGGLSIRPRGCDRRHPRQHPRRMGRRPAVANGREMARVASCGGVHGGAAARPVDAARRIRHDGAAPEWAVCLRDFRDQRCVLVRMLHRRAGAGCARPRAPSRCW